MSKYSRREILSLAGVSLATTVLAACGGGQAAPAASSAAPAPASSSPAVSAKPPAAPSSPASAGASPAAGAASGSASGSPAASAAPVAGGRKVKVTLFAFLGGDLGKMPKAFAQDYMKRNPSVQMDVYEDSNSVGYPKMVAARKTTPDQPLVNFGFFNAQTSFQGDGDKMWSPLDYSAMSNIKDIPKVFQRDNHNGIGIGTDEIGLLYNTKQLNPPPTSWADLWADRVKGKDVFFDHFWYIAYMAARLNGGSADLNNFQAGWDFWKQRAKWIRAIVTSNPQYLDALSSGTGILTSYFNGTGLQWARGGAPIGYVPPKEGAIAVPVYLQLVAGSSKDQQEVCQQAINEMISPEWCKQWAETSIEAPANTKVQLSPDLAKLPAFSQDTISKLISLDWGVVGKNLPDWNTKWDQDIKANI